jgi:hypothetical protein
MFKGFKKLTFQIYNFYTKEKHPVQENFPHLYRFNAALMSGPYLLVNARPLRVRGKQKKRLP